jgi:hypothetical protein
MYRLRLAVVALGVTVVTAGDPVPAGADAVLDWNITALQTTALAPFNPPLEARNLAIVHAAMFDAVNAITREFCPYAVRRRAPRWASPEAAAVAAAHVALVQLYAEQQSMLDAAYNTSLAAISDGSQKARGIETGERVARALLAMRASDGAAAAVSAPYSPGSQPGDWIPTAPTFLPALDPGWGTVRPFFLRRGSQFRPGPPPALNSAQYTRDFDEIKAIGSIVGASRTQDQTDLARFWISTAAQNWNPAARDVARRQARTLSQNARAFALLNMAGADAFIAAWDAKFAYNQWRPVTAIRAADRDGNPDTAPDPSWTPLLVTPRFPDYIAGHTTYAGAAQSVLERVFGSHPGTMTLSSATALDVVKTYSTFEEIADGVVEARVWGGIHWRTSSVRGRTVGAEIGRYAACHFLRPRGDDASRDGAGVRARQSRPAAR